MQRNDDDFFPSRNATAGPTSTQSASGRDGENEDEYDGYRTSLREGFEPGRESNSSFRGSTPVLSSSDEGHSDSRKQRRAREDAGSYEAAKGEGRRQKQQEEGGREEEEEESYDERRPLALQIPISDDAEEAHVPDKFVPRTNWHGVTKADSCREFIPDRIQFGLRDEQMPPPMRILYVTEGYRFGGTVKDCILSLFTLKPHTEWLNAWTMIVLWFIGVAFFAHSLLVILPHCKSHDITPFLFHFFTCTALIPGSLGNHTFCCRGPRVHAYWRRADVTGILTAVITLNVAVAYEAFHGVPWLQVLWPVIAACYSAFFLYKAWTKDYYKHGLNRKQYTLSCGGGAILYMIPPFCVLFRDAIWGGTFTAAGAGALGLSGSLFLGGFLFSHHIPESLSYFQSHRWSSYCTGHTLMHFLLWTAHLSSYTFLASMFLRRHDHVALTYTAP